MTRARKTGIASGAPFTHVWHWLSRLPGRKGQLLRILLQRKDGLLWIEFEDGFRTICSAHAIRKAPARSGSVGKGAGQLSLLEL